MRNNIKIQVLIVIIFLLIVYLFISYPSPAKLYGRWYLYIGNDINTEKNISEKLSSKDYLDISETEVKEYSADGTDGVSFYRKRGNKIYVGDAIFNFSITNISEERVLLLKLIGYNVNGDKWYIENGETLTYVFDRGIDE